MFSHLYIFLLASLAQSNPLLPSLHSNTYLPQGCRDFTVGSCNPEEDELIDIYPRIPDAPLCQEICRIQEGCNYFRWSKSSLECSLYHYRFLASCNIISGPKNPSIDECAKEENPSCDSFVRENCTYSMETMSKESVTDAHACQDLLRTIGFIYGSEYFSFDSNTQVCSFYKTKDVVCDAISGPWDPIMDTCSPTTEAPTTVPTTVTIVPTTTVTTKPSTTVTTEPTTTVTTEPTTTVSTKSTTRVTTSSTTTTSRKPTTRPTSRPQL